MALTIIKVSYNIASAFFQKIKKRRFSPSFQNRPSFLESVDAILDFFVHIIVANWRVLALRVPFNPSNRLHDGGFVFGWRGKVQNIKARYVQSFFGKVVRGDYDVVGIIPILFLDVSNAKA